MYSGTPPKVAIYNIMDTLFGPKCIYMFVYNQTPEMRTLPYFIKQTGSPGQSQKYLNYTKFTW